MFYHEEFKRIKKESITAAKELGYTKETQQMIENAKTEREITFILKQARLREEE